MATFTKTVDPNGGSDYLSLRLWEAGEGGLYTSGDIVIADCKRTGPTKDTSYCAINGWGTGVIPKIIVNVAHRHEGKFADTRDSDGNYIYTMRVEATSPVFDIRQHYTTIDGVVIDAVGIGNYQQTGIQHTNPTYGITVSNNIIKNSNPIEINPRFGIFQGSTGTTADNFIYNNIVYGYTGSSGYGIYQSYGNTYVYNNTVYGCDGGIRANNGNLYAINNVSLGNVTSDYSGTFGAGTDYNVSSDATAPGTTVATGKTSYATYFTDHTAGDFHLTDTSLNLFGIASADLSATFTDDIDGDTRPSDSTFGLGADYYVAAGGGATILPALVSETLSVLSPSLQAGAVTISPALTALALAVNQITIPSGLTTISPALLSLTATVNNLSVLPGAVTISPELLSLSLLISNPSLAAVTLISPALTSLTVSVPDITAYLLYVINPSLVSLVSSVNEPAIPYEQFVTPVLTSLTLSTYLPSLLTGDIIQAAVTQLTSLVSSPSIQSGSVVIRPSLTSLTVEAMNPRLFDPALINEYFYFNQSAIEFFKQQTGLDSNQFNELAKAYYRQVTSEDDEAFNELEAKAQKAAGFKGLSPTDWRNF